MKRLTALLTAALIALTVSTTAFAVPTDESSIQTSGNSSESKPEESSVATAESSVFDPEKISYKSFELKNADMTIDLPSDMYFLTPDIAKNDPALSAAKTTAEEVKKSFSENGTLLKAFTKDFSFDINVTMSENDRTKTIDNLLSLSDSELEEVANALLESDYTTGCAKNTYNGTLFLTLDTEYKSSDTEIYGVQEYTVVNGKNVIITFQSHTGQFSKNTQKLVKEIMNNTTFAGIEAPVEISDAGLADVTDLDPRYMAILIASVIGLAALASMIIVGTKYRQSRLAAALKDDSEVHKTGDSDIIIKTPNTQIPVDDETEDVKINKDSEKKIEEKPYDSSIFETKDENVLFTNEKVLEERELREKTKNIPRLDSATELSIPKNPYTPVGKAEAVEQPAMSVTTEFAKLSNISAEELKNAKKSNSDTDGTTDEDTVVFAENTPKAKTEIEQIGEEVFADDQSDSTDGNGFGTENDIKSVGDIPETQEENKISDTQTDLFSAAVTQDSKEDIPQNVSDTPEEELSEYEKRFGKGRKNNFQNPSDVNKDDSVSKFEKHFGKLQPASAKQNTAADTIAAVDPVIKSSAGFFAADKSQKSYEKTLHDETQITITKAPPKIPEPEISAQAVVKITRTSPMPNISGEKTKQTEQPQMKAETEQSVDIEQPNESTAESKPEDLKTESGSTEKKGILRIFTEKLFEPEEAEEDEFVEDEKESTNKFVNSFKDKFKYRRPEPENDPLNDTNKPTKYGTEIYRSADAPKSNHIELSVKKNEDGDTVIDSVSDETGKPVKITIKDGESSSETKSKSKKKKKKSNKNDKQNKKSQHSADPTGVIGAAAGVAGVAGVAAETAANTALKAASETAKDTVENAKTVSEIISNAKDTVSTDNKTDRKNVSEDKAASGSIKDEVKPKSDSSGVYGKTENKAVSDGGTEKTAGKTDTDSSTEETASKTDTDTGTEETASKTDTDSSTEETASKTDTDTGTEETTNKTDTDTGAEETTNKTDTDTGAEETASKTDTDTGAEETTNKTDTDSSTEETASKTDTDTGAEETTNKTDTDTGAEENASKTDTDTGAGETTNKTDTDTSTEETASKTDTDTNAEETASKTDTDTSTEETADKTDTDTSTEETASKTDTDSNTEETVNTADTDISTKETVNTTDTNTNTEETVNTADTDTNTEETANADTDTNTEETANKTDTDTSTEETMNKTVNEKAEEPDAETPAAEFVFERDTGIIFERAIIPSESYVGNITPLTSIPRLESVNANDYNKLIEEMHKQSAENEEIQPQAEPVAEISEPAEYDTSSYYDNTEDDTLDPFAPGSGEMTLKEIDKKSSPKLSERIKRSLGKIFSSADDEG